MITRITPKILARIPRRWLIIPFLTEIPTTRPRIPNELSTCGPRPFCNAIQAISQHLPHEIATKHTPRPLILPILLNCSLHTATTASLSSPTVAAACCLRAWPVLPAADFNTHPPPSLSNQTPTTTLFQPHDDPDDLPLLRVPVRTSAMAEFRNAPRRYKTLRHVDRIDYSTRPLPLAYLDSSTATLCLTRQSKQRCATFAFKRTSAFFPTCAILLRVVT